MFKKTSSDRRDLSLFFLVAFTWTWLLDLPRLMAEAGWISLPGWLSPVLGYVAVFGPSVAAFGLIGLGSGREGVRTLWRRGWKVYFPKIWLIPALFLFPVCGLLTLGVLTMLGISLPPGYRLPPAMLIPVGLMIWLLGALPEEYGWRGFVLDRLQNHLKPLPASLFLGVLWSLWHLPLHFIPGTTQAVIPFWEFAAQTVVLTVLYTWLHNETSGSVLIAGLFHATGNLTGAVIPYWITSAGRWISFLFLLLPAVWVVVAKFTRPAHPVR